jgi:nucleotide-binding universal stress UspA family protein
MNDDQHATVLVAVNGGPESRSAARTAATVASSLGRRLRVCLVTEYDEPASGAEGRLVPIAESVACADAKALPFPDFYDDDDAGRVHAICDEARRGDAALIVVGRHKKRTLSSLQGTVTERLLRESRRPIIIATAARETPYEGVVVAVDFSAYSPAAVEAARAVAPDAAITLVHALEPNLPRRLSGLGAASDEKAALDARLKGLAADLSGTVQTAFGEGAPRDVLAAAVRERKADLLVLGTRGRSGLARAVLGSVAAAFVQDPPCDVLLVPAPLEARP